MPKLTKEELAAQLDGCEYRDDFPKELLQAAKENNLVIIHGASDDLIELRGAITEEWGADSVFRLTRKGVPEQVKDELRRAEKIHGGFNSFHEAIAIIREEFLELEREIFWGIQKTKRLDGILSEAIQLCAMSLRLAVMVSHVPA